MFVKFVIVGNNMSACNCVFLFYFSSHVSKQSFMCMSLKLILSVIFSFRKRHENSVKQCWSIILKHCFQACECDQPNQITLTLPSFIHIYCGLQRHRHNFLSIFLLTPQSKVMNIFTLTHIKNATFRFLGKINNPISLTEDEPCSNIRWYL